MSGVAESDPIREQAIFLDALERPAGPAREEFLRAACEGDELLHRGVRELLAAFDTAAGAEFLEQPAVAFPGEDASEQVGERVDAYELVRELGEGGFGVVYEAVQREPVRRRVALKILKAGMDTRAVVARFEAERQALAQLDHPGIARFHDAGTAGSGRPYFVMELVEGASLVDYCEAHALSITARLELFVMVADAVTHAHQRGLIHRDLKPANVLVGEDDAGLPRPKVIDFGIAKALGESNDGDSLLRTQGEQLLGTPQYLSPEQVRGSAHAVDTRTDVHGLGLILYELLTGTTPLDARTAASASLAELERRVAVEEPQKPSARAGDQRLAGELDWIVLRALAKDPDRRYPTAGDLAADVRRYLADEPVAARPPSTLYLARKFARRHRLAVLSATALVTLVVTFGVIGLSLAREAREARDDEATERARAASAAAAARHAYSQADFRVANELIEGDRVAAGIAHLCRALRTDPGNAAAATKLCSTLAGASLSQRVFPAIELDGRPIFLAFSPDGDRIVAASNDGRVTVWSARTGAAVPLPAMQHSDATYAPAAADRARTRVALGSVRGNVEVFDVNTGERLCRGMAHENDAVIREVGMSPDGTRVFSAAHDACIRAWNASTGEPLWVHRHETSELPTRRDDDPARATCLDVSTDGSLVVAGFGDGQAVVLQAATGEVVTEADCHDGVIYRVRFTPQSDRFATASWGGAAGVWDSKSGEAIGWEMFHDAPVYNLAFSPCGGRLATASYDHTARIWDACTGEPLSRPLLHDGEVYGIAFNASGRMLATSSASDAAQLWDGHTGEPLCAPLEHERPPGVLTFSPDGTRLLTGTRNFRMHLWDVRPRQAHALTLEHDRPLAWLGLEEGGGCLTLTRRGEVCRWNALSGELLASEQIPEAAARGWARTEGGHLPLPLRVAMASGEAREQLAALLASLDSRDVLCHALADDGAWLVAGGRQGRVTLVSRSAAAHTLVASENDFTRVAISSPGGRALLGDTRGRVVAIDLETGALAHGWQAHEEQITSLVVSPDGTRAATGSLDNSARIWDVATGQPITVALSHDDVAWRGGFWCRFAGDEALVTYGSADGTLRIWNALDGSAIAASPLDADAVVLDAALSLDGRRVLAGTHLRGGKARGLVWSTRTGDLLAPARVMLRPIQRVALAPDGTLAALTDDRGTVHVHSEPPLVAEMPHWFLELAESLGGRRLNEHGVLELIETPSALLTPTGAEDDLERWAAWLVADPEERTLSPRVTVTHAEHVDRLIARNTRSALRNALLLAPSRAEIHAALARSLRRGSQSERRTREASFHLRQAGR